MIRRMLILLPLLFFPVGTALQCWIASSQASDAANRVSVGMSVGEDIRAAQAPNYYVGRVCLPDGTETEFSASLNFRRAWFQNEPTPVLTHDDISELASSMRFCGPLTVGFYGCLSNCSGYIDIHFDENARVLSVTAPRVRF